MKRLIAVLALSISAFGQVAFQPALVPRMVFWDTSGNLLRGGQVCSYDSGTLNARATYKDNLGTANSLCITLDAAGGATIYTGQFAYRFRTFTSLGALQFDIDPVTNFSQFILGVSNTWTVPQILQGGTSDPTGTAGMFWYRTDLTRLRMFDTAWHSVVGQDTTDTLTNKTVSSPTWSGTGSGAFANGNTVSATPSGIVAPAYLVAGVPTFLYVTADFTTPADTALHAINGLTFNTPANQALVIPFVCDVMYSQATAAAANSFGIQDSPIAPTNIAAMGDVWTSATATTAGNLPTLTTTTATAFVTFTPSAAGTIFNAHWGGTIQHPSNATPSSVFFMFATGNSADLLTIKQGSMCRLF